MRFKTINDLPEHLQSQVREKLEMQTNTPIPSANLECSVRRKPVEKKRNKGLDTQCCIHVHHRECRSKDTDGYSLKALIDGLVRGGLLADDKKEIVLQITETREKCKKDEEQTIIEIWEV